MNINFEHYGKFIISFTYDDGTTDYYKGGSEGYTLKEGADFISANIENSLSIVSADIIDAETGEIVATLEREEDDDWGNEEPYFGHDWRDDEFLEFGYDPYMGCYSYDC